MERKRPFYYQYAWAYDLIVEPKTEKRVRFFKEIFELLNLSDSAKILDAGCGTGNLAMALASEGFNVTGIDVSESFVNNAIKQNPENSNPYFIVGDILKIEYTNTFDAIICRGVLNDIIDETARKAVFSIFHQALKPNGIFIADVREWNETIKRKTLDPVLEKQVNTENGLLTFMSETHLNKAERMLEISEIHQLISDEKTSCSKNFFKMKCWTLEEIVEYSNDTHFSIEKVFGDYETNSKIGQTDRLVFVLAKTDTTNL
jgi:2-polyprenyl-3-methyl-5-hydroxy-6-metoxy-1,4-benzoquinol methylase